MEKTTPNIARRRFLTAASVSATGLALSGCDTFDRLSSRDDEVRAVLEKANRLSYRVQRMLIGGNRLAQEFSESDIRQAHRANGISDPIDEDYKALVPNKFADYRLEVTGLVKTSKSFSLADIKSMPSRTQITRHDCVEGWSSIAKWTGTPLSTILDQVGVKDSARFVVFECFDTIEQTLSGLIKYYESIDLIDARHAQTILAYGMNGMDLPVANGAPLRVRVERQLGYKHAKYIRKITLVDDLAPFGAGYGSYWADTGYEWYAGI
ncbi:MAG: molybdopterin-dependent oxidoreductase [Rhizobiaceae bacterium]